MGVTAQARSEYASNLREPLPLRYQKPKEIHARRVLRRLWLQPKTCHPLALIHKGSRPTGPISDNSPRL